MTLTVVSGALGLQTHVKHKNFCKHTNYNFPLSFFTHLYTAHCHPPYLTQSITHLHLCKLQTQCAPQVKEKEVISFQRSNIPPTTPNELHRKTIAHQAHHLGTGPIETYLTHSLSCLRTTEQPGAVTCLRTTTSTPLTKPPEY